MVVCVNPLNIKYEWEHLLLQGWDWLNAQGIQNLWEIITSPEREEWLKQNVPFLSFLFLFLLVRR